MKKNYLIYALWMAVFLSSNVVSAQNYFGDFPVKADPKTVGNKLSKRLMETKHVFSFFRVHIFYNGGLIYFSFRTGTIDKMPVTILLKTVKI